VRSSRRHGSPYITLAKRSIFSKSLYNAFFLWYTVKRILCKNEGEQHEVSYLRLAREQGDRFPSRV
jgi:hypothetical protein